MPDFESIIKFLVLFGGFLGIVIGAGFGFKSLVRRSRPQVDGGGDTPERLKELEGRLAELEERLDFTERALADVRARPQIPAKH